MQDSDLLRSIVFGRVLKYRNWSIIMQDTNLLHPLWKDLSDNTRLYISHDLFLAVWIKKALKSWD